MCLQCGRYACTLRREVGSLTVDADRAMLQRCLRWIGGKAEPGRLVMHDHEVVFGHSLSLTPWSGWRLTAMYPIRYIAVDTNIQ